MQQMLLTMIFNIHEQTWDEELLSLFDIPASMLPEVMDSSDDFGYTNNSLFGAEIPILGVAGDQQAALFGQACFDEGMAKKYLRYGLFLNVEYGR